MRCRTFTDRTQIKDGKLILASSDSVRKRLILLTLASTLPFKLPRAPDGHQAGTAIPITPFCFERGYMLRNIRLTF